MTDEKIPNPLLDAAMLVARTFVAGGHRVQIGRTEAGAYEVEVRTLSGRHSAGLRLDPRQLYGQDPAYVAAEFIHHLRALLDKEREGAADDMNRHDRRRERT